MEADAHRLNGAETTCFLPVRYETLSGTSNEAGHQCQTGFAACSNHDDGAFLLHATARTGCKADCKHSFSSEKGSCHSLRKHGNMQAYGKCMEKSRNHYIRCRLRCVGIRSDRTSKDSIKSNENDSEESSKDSGVSEENLASVTLGRRQWKRLLFSSFL